MSNAIARSTAIVARYRNNKLSAVVQRISAILIQKLKFNLKTRPILFAFVSSQRLHVVVGASIFNLHSQKLSSLIKFVQQFPQVYFILALN